MREVDDGALGEDDYVRVEGSAIWIRVPDLPERFHIPVHAAPVQGALVQAVAPREDQMGIGLPAPTQGRMSTQLSRKEKGFTPSLIYLAIVAIVLAAVTVGATLWATGMPPALSQPSQTPAGAAAPDKEPPAPPPTAPAPVANPAPANTDPVAAFYKRALPQARAALNALKKIQARTEVGTSRQKFGEVLGEQYAEVKLFLESPEGRKMDSFSSELSEAIQEYKKAQGFWDPDDLADIMLPKIWAEASKHIKNAEAILRDYENRYGDSP